MSDYQCTVANCVVCAKQEMIDADKPAFKKIYQNKTSPEYSTHQKPFYCRLVKPEDLNPANALFGGRVLEWLDEAAALYTMRTLQRDRIVTKTISEINFRAPAKVGAFIEFFFDVKEVGTTSVTIAAKIFRKDMKLGSSGHTLILDCCLVFVAVDEDGKKTPHNYKRSANGSKENS